MRVVAVEELGGETDPEYSEGLRQAVCAALEYGFEAIERGEERAPPVPTALLGQARLAARSGVGIDTVLRSYFAGYALFGDFLMEEVERDRDLPRVALKDLWQTHAALFDRLIAAVTEEYEREAANRFPSGEERRVSRVRRLLDGEPLDTASLSYDFDGWHLGVVVAGRDAALFLRELAAARPYSLLAVRPTEETVWAWLGSRRPLSSRDVERHGSEARRRGVVLAIGEPAERIAGWRLTHRQAIAALSVGLRGEEAVVRYADVALLAAILRDDLLLTSLQRLYLAPLEEARDGGETLRDTLRAYFAANRNVSSAAAALGVSRQAVTSRLRTAEERIGRPLACIGAELESALRFDAFTKSRSPL